MHRPVLLLLVAALLASAGCSTSRLHEYPTSATALTGRSGAKIKRGVIEPGFTPEMVYMALGKPTEPAANLADATRDGTWIYRNFQGDETDFVRAGFSRHVVFDPERRTSKVVTEPVDASVLPQLEPNSVQVVFHEGHVVEIRRAPAG